MKVCSTTAFTFKDTSAVLPSDDTVVKQIRLRKLSYICATLHLEYWEKNYLRYIKMKVDYTWERIAFRV